MFGLGKPSPGIQATVARAVATKKVSGGGVGSAPGLLLENGSGVLLLENGFRLLLE